MRKRLVDSGKIPEEVTMSAMYIAAAVVGGVGIIAALGIVSLRLISEMPPSFTDGSDDWLYAEMNYLWWDEGIGWSPHHV